MRRDDDVGEAFGRAFGRSFIAWLEGHAAAITLGLLIGTLIGIVILVAGAGAGARPAERSVVANIATAQGCETRACWRRVHRARAWRYCVRKHGRRGCTFRRKWRELPSARRAYIVALMGCENGSLPWDGDGSGFVYRAEWHPNTWAAAGGRAEPRPLWHEEAVRVHRWELRVGHHSSAGWPNCPR
jgi:hypothetical protein